MQTIARAVSRLTHVPVEADRAEEVAARIARALPGGAVVRVRAAGGPRADRGLAAADVARVRRLRRDVEEAEAAAAAVRRGERATLAWRVDAARTAEREALAALGFASHAEFLVHLARGGAPPRPPAAGRPAEAAIRRACAAVPDGASLVVVVGAAGGGEVDAARAVALVAGEAGERAVVFVGDHPGVEASVRALGGAVLPAPAALAPGDGPAAAGDTCREPRMRRVRPRRSPAAREAPPAPPSRAEARADARAEAEYLSTGHAEPIGARRAPGGAPRLGGCARHPNAAARARCRRCGRLACAACAVAAGGRLGTLCVGCALVAAGVRVPRRGRA